MEQRRALPERPTRLAEPVDDDPGACSVPRGGGWRPGARWATVAETRARVALEAAGLPAHQRPPMRELGRRSEPAAHPFRAMPPDEGSSHDIAVAPRKPVAWGAPTVLVATSGQRELVTAACPVALSLGLRTGMPATQARSSVAGLEVRAADPDGDRHLLERLALHAVRKWTPTAEPAPPDGLWLDLTGVAHLFGGEERLCRRLVAFCQRAGFTARVGLAGTPGAAHALARFTPGPVTIASPGSEAQLLADLPLTALRLPDDVLSAAARFGFEQIADLYALPRGPLAKRLGLATVTRLDQALGRVAEPITGVVPFELPTAQRRLLEPIGTAESLSTVSADLIVDLVDVLRTRAIGARALDLSLLRVDGSEQHVVFGTSLATREPKHLARLLGLRIEAIDPGPGIEEMRLTVTRAEPLGVDAIALKLGGESHAADLAPLIDIIAGRIGAARLFKATSVESDVPERAVTALPPLQFAIGWDCWRRPARLLRHPEPLSNVVALLPDQPPRRFSWRGQSHVVRAGDGPERIFGEWWRRDGEVWAIRDYYCVENEHGARFWIFRRGDGVDANTGDLSWHMHGVFG